MRRKDIEAGKDYGYSHDPARAFAPGYTGKCSVDRVTVLSVTEPWRDWPGGRVYGQNGIKVRFHTGYRVKSKAGPEEVLPGTALTSKRFVGLWSEVEPKVAEAEAAWAVAKERRAASAAARQVQLKRLLTVAKRLGLTYSQSLYGSGEKITLNTLNDLPAWLELLESVADQKQSESTILSTSFE